MRPFIIYALPRSRTFWLSQFLRCGHDELRHIRGLDDIQSMLAMGGSVETAAAPWWRIINHMAPTIRTAVIRRPVDDVMASLLATGVAYDVPLLERYMRRLDAKLNQIEARVSGVLSVRFDELREEGACAALFEHCTGHEIPLGWFDRMAPLRLTCDLEAVTRYFVAHLPQLERVGRLAKQRMLAKIAARPVTSDRMTFQQEPFDDFLRDAESLFGQHLIEVGEHPENWQAKNLELMRALESIGALYVTTARSNGRMFGYLMAIVAPQFDSHHGTDAVHTLFYASPDAPGIGLKLQRASVEFLRGLGVDQVAFRAGTRGTGPKQGALFRRLGAQNVGEMFTLNLKDVA